MTEKFFFYVFIAKLKLGALARKTQNLRHHLSVLLNRTVSFRFFDGFKVTDDELLGGVLQLGSVVEVGQLEHVGGILHGQRFAELNLALLDEAFHLIFVGGRQQFGSQVVAFHIVRLSESDKRLQGFGVDVFDDGTASLSLLGSISSTYLKGSRNKKINQNGKRYIFAVKYSC